MLFLLYLPSIYIGTDYHGKTTTKINNVNKYQQKQQTVGLGWGVLFCRRCCCCSCYCVDFGVFRAESVLLFSPLCRGQHCSWVPMLSNHHTYYSSTAVHRTCVRSPLDTIYYLLSPYYCTVCSANIIPLLCIARALSSRYHLLSNTTVLLPALRAPILQQGTHAQLFSFLLLWHSPWEHNKA